MASVTKEIERYMNKVAKRLAADTRSGVLKAAAYGAGVTNQVSRWRVGVRTGELSRSFASELVPSPVENPMAQVYSPLVYAGIHDTGGRIRPRTRKALAIPQFRNPIGMWPRHFARGELYRVGNQLRHARSGKTLFILARSVQIQPTGYLEVSRQNAEPGIEAILAEAITAAPERA